MRKAVLLGVTYRKNNRIEKNLAELAELARSVGILPVAHFWQVLRHPVKTYVGKGKLEKIAQYITLYDADGVITDDELTPVQKSRLEKLLKVEVLDRTQVILEDFARSARTSEGKTEIELARLEYKLSHIKGSRSDLSRTAGGIGTRGPGESKLESDRRVVRKRIARLRSKIKKIAEERSLKRQKRLSSILPKISITGYTNAGKSMLLKTLSGFNVKSEDKLFTTLDPTTKKVWLGENVFALFSDTVGFISKLPPQLVKAFRSTLEEVLDANFIILVADGHDEDMDEKLRVSEEILNRIGANDIPKITVINKIDVCDKLRIGELLHKYSNAVFISAKKNLYVDELVSRLREEITKDYLEREIEVPCENWHVISRKVGIRVMSSKQVDNVVRARLKIHPSLVNKIEVENRVLS